MYRTIASLTHEHNHWMVAVAALVCVVGTCLTSVMIQRLIHAKGTRKHLRLILTSTIAGATIWSTHFIAMLAYDPGFEHGYEPLRTGLSLGIAVFGILLSNHLFIFRRGDPAFLLGGVSFGLTVSIMHFVGMSAYLLPGTLGWHWPTLAASVGLGLILGVAAYHRLVCPGARHRSIGDAALMTLAICTMHFTGMGAIEVQLSPLVEVPPQVISDTTLGFLVLFVTSIVFLIGFASVSIETNMESEAQVQLRDAGHHDPLTGLPNRIQLNLNVEKISARLESDEKERVAVVIINLNLFKQVNDLHGHPAGDTVLTTIAKRLMSTLREDEFVARTGGDEFVALKQDFHNIDQVMAFAKRLHGLIVAPIETQHTSLTVGAAIGIATTLDSGRDLLELINKGDQAMYRAKAEPHRDICLFNAEIDQQNRDRLHLVSDLGQAEDRGEFELAYQLQNDLGSLDAIGFEALLRWSHPERGPISPGQFIPIAEETGLIRSIGLWVLRTACKEAASWPVPYSIAVNVAPQQLVQPCFLENVSDILIESRLRPERLELEVTEASIIEDQANTLRVMHKLKEMGVRIAMDDFGTGYSSLAMLQAFPFDKIKIDRNFICDVHKHHQRAAIVRSTLLLGEALNIPILAEGVETAEELDFLRAEKCAAVQGFYFGKPLNVENVRQLVSQNTKRAAS